MVWCGETQPTRSALVSDMAGHDVEIVADAIEVDDTLLAPGEAQHSHASLIGTRWTVGQLQCQRLLANPP